LLKYINKVTGKKVDRLMCLGTVLFKDEEFVIDFRPTYDMKKLLLTFVTLVSPLIPTLVMTNINLM